MKKTINKSQIKVSLQLKIKFEFIVVDQGNAYCRKTDRLVIF